MTARPAAAGALLAALLAALCAPSRAASGAGDWDARLGAVRGEATVVSAAGGEEAAAEEGMPLEPGDRIEAGEGAEVELVLDGGSLVTLRSGSRLEVRSASREAGELFLSAGALLARLAKLERGTFCVRTLAAVASVRGTDFGVEAEEGATFVAVFDEGKVEVSGESGPPELLISNQETEVRRGAAPLHAYQLRRLARHRSLMRAHGRRLAALRAAWRPLAPAERRSLREGMLERLRARRRELLRRRRAPEGPRERPRLHEKAREHQRKMDERRRRARGRRPGGPR